MIYLEHGSLNMEINAGIAIRYVVLEEACLRSEKKYTFGRIKELGNGKDGFALVRFINLTS